MYKYITCPECGQRLCRADYGSKIESSCYKCRAEFKANVDKDGVLHIATITAFAESPQKKVLATKKYNILHKHNLILNAII